MLRSLMAGVLVSAAASAAAHDTWLVAAPPAASRRAGLLLDLTSGGEFPEPDHAIEAARIETAAHRLAGVTTPLRVGAPGEHALRLSADAGGEGVATAWVSLKPRTLELRPEEVAEYLKEIGAAEASRRWAARPSPKTWRETYRKHAKTFVTAGETKGDLSWREPVGLVLEIVPERDPTALRAADTLAVRVLKGGRPLGGFPLRAACAGRAAGTLRRTDVEGRASFVLDQPGAWLLAGTDLREAGQEWQSDFTTLTVHVEAGAAQ